MVWRDVGDETIEPISGGFVSRLSVGRRATVAADRKSKQKPRLRTSKDKTSGLILERSMTKRMKFNGTN